MHCMSYNEHSLRCNAYSVGGSGGSDVHDESLSATLDVPRENMRNTPMASNEETYAHSHHSRAPGHPRCPDADR